MDFSLLQAIYIFVATFLGETFGTLFGGGSFFIQPALLAANIPGSAAIANDVAAAVFSNLAFLWFFRKEKKQIGNSEAIKISLWMAPTMIIGAFIGGNILSMLSEQFLTYFIIVISFIGFIYAIYKINNNSSLELVAEKNYFKHWKVLSVFAGLGFGLYDGVSGAGGGVLLILFLALCFKIDMKTIFSLANILSTISLLSAAITFLFLGLLSFKLLALMIPSCILAGAAGAKIAMLIPEKGLRIAYALSICMLISYLITTQIGLF